MCETPKEKVSEPSKPAKDRPKSYYYDDAHGYEEYDPSSDETEKDDEDESELT